MENKIVSIAFQRGTTRSQEIFTPSTPLKKYFANHRKVLKWHPWIGYSLKCLSNGTEYFVNTLSVISFWPITPIDLLIGVEISNGLIKEPETCHGSRLPIERTLLSNLFEVAVSIPLEMTTLMLSSSMGLVLIKVVEYKLFIL